VVRPRHLACIQHARIDQWEHRLRSHQSLRAGTRNTLRRARPYLPRVRRIFIKAGLPPSLALLPVIESEFYRTAQGGLDDRGLWQFRVATAQRFGLVVNERRDQRLHPYRASRAAARYLRMLHRRYGGDWALALAAYNAGENRVDRARARRPGASFWQLAEDNLLPPTTRNYVPRVLAVIRVVDGEGACKADGGSAPPPLTTMAKVEPRPAPTAPCGTTYAPGRAATAAETARFAGL
jgi:membrane-bound lytic murein transglycosylase D